MNFNIAPEVSFQIVMLRRDVDDKSIGLTWFYYAQVTSYKTISM